MHSPSQIKVNYYPDTPLLFRLSSTLWFSTPSKAPSESTSSTTTYLGSKGDSKAIKIDLTHFLVLTRSNVFVAKV